MNRERNGFWFGGFELPVRRWVNIVAHRYRQLPRTIREAIKPYSEDVHLRIVETNQDGMSKSAAARLFSGSLYSVKRYARIAKGES